MKNKKQIYILFVTIIFLIAGCVSIENYRMERIDKADKAFKKIKGKNFPKNAVLTLPFCIKTALNNNLDLKVYELKEAVNNEQKTAAMLGMLPNLVVTNDVSDRSNDPGASSYNITTGLESLPYSQSAEKQENRIRAELLFSVIDFGLSYFKYVQQEDKAIITTEQKRRATQNLILNVTRAYFRVASAQYAMDTTKKMISLSEDTEALLKEMVKNKTVPLANILQENKKFIVLKKALMEYKRSYQNSCIELRSLMGFYPTHEIKVDTSAMNELNEITMLNMDFLEETALLTRPELFQLDVQSHITKIEARKTILMMFPNVSIFGNFTNSSNKFLYNQSWWESGVRAAYQLLRLPQQIETYLAYDTELDQLDAQILALSIGVLAQVRIAYANLHEVKQRYDLAESLYEIYEKHKSIVEIKAKSAGDFSKIELNRVTMETAQKSIERVQTLGNYYLAYYRLLNSIGLESLDIEIINKIKKRVKKSIKNNTEDEIEEIAELTSEKNECTTEINILKNKISKLRKIRNSDKEINSYKLEIKEINKKLYDINKKLAKVKNVVSRQNEKLDKYNKAIELLSKNQLTNIKSQPKENIPKVLPLKINASDFISEVKQDAKMSAIGGISSMNMEMQQQTSNNTISPEEYIGTAKNNTLIETQLDAGNNNIKQESFNPLTQKNINIQTQQDAGNNQLVGQEFNTSSSNSRQIPNKEIDNALAAPLPISYAVLLRKTKSKKSAIRYKKAKPKIIRNKLSFLKPDNYYWVVAYISDSYDYVFKKAQKLKKRGYKWAQLVLINRNDIISQDNALTEPLPISYAVLLRKTKSKKSAIRYKKAKPKIIRNKLSLLKPDNYYWVVAYISDSYEYVFKKVQTLKKRGYKWAQLVLINRNDIISQDNARQKPLKISSPVLLKKTKSKKKAIKYKKPIKYKKIASKNLKQIPNKVIDNAINKPLPIFYAILLKKCQTKKSAIKYKKRSSIKIRDQLSFLKQNNYYWVVANISDSYDYVFEKVQTLKKRGYKWAKIILINRNDIISQDNARQETLPISYAILLKTTKSKKSAIRYKKTSSKEIRNELALLKEGNKYLIIYYITNSYDDVYKKLQTLKKGSYNWGKIILINKKDIIY